MTDHTLEALALIERGWKTTASGRWRHERLNLLGEGGRVVLVTQDQAAAYQVDWDTHDQIAAASAQGALS